MLLDTSGLLCYYNRSEPEHPKAKRCFEENRKKLTHSYVLAEFVALAQVRRLPRQGALAFALALLEHPGIEVVWAGEALHRQALRLLEVRLDKRYTLCDAVSFVLMKERGLHKALTTDRHFEQEGFGRLLKQQG